MKRLALLIAFCIYSLSNTSCVSSMIASDGLDVTKLKTERQCQRKLGKPIYFANYNPPEKISTTPEFVRNIDQIHEANREKDQFYNESLSADRLCVYQTTGTFYGTDVEYAMASAMSFGLAEPFLIVRALREKNKYKEQKIYVSAWFNSRGEVISILKGKISD